MHLEPLHFFLQSSQKCNPLFYEGICFVFHWIFFLLSFFLHFFLLCLLLRSSSGLGSADPGKKKSGAQKKCKKKAGKKVNCGKK
jgi:hypothetical protein